MSQRGGRSRSTSPALSRGLGSEAEDDFHSVVSAEESVGDEARSIVSGRSATTGGETGATSEFQSVAEMSEFGTPGSPSRRGMLATASARGSDDDGFASVLDDDEDDPSRSLPSGSAPGTRSAGVRKDDFQNIASGDFQAVASGSQELRTGGPSDGRREELTQLFGDESDDEGYVMPSLAEAQANMAAAAGPSLSGLQPASEVEEDAAQAVLSSMMEDEMRSVLSKGVLSTVSGTVLEEEEEARRAEEKEKEAKGLRHRNLFKRGIAATKMAVRFENIADNLRRMPLAPDAGTMRGYVLVDKSKSRMKPTYRYYVQDNDGGEDKFILAARKEAGLKMRRYIMSTDPEDCGRVGPGYFGKLVSNMFGSKYTMFDRGSRRGPEVAPEDKRHVLGAVLYEPTVFQTGGGYRKLTALLPNLYETEEALPHKLERWEEMQDLRNMHLLTTKLPSYKKINGEWHYAYRFGGRVKLPSPKNMQIVLDGDQDAVVLLFGKIAKNLYALDFTYPLSAHQAFSIALSSMDSKLCCAF